ncbi:MAG: hypothetical protein GXW99_01470 [Clostridiales bacterium]|nr:hypothetical protein [Clostridiales bacterium]
MKKWRPLLWVIAIIVLLLVMPAEKTLGQWIKWVYLHASFDAIGLLGFYGAALLSLLFLLGGRKDGLVHWASALWKTGTLFWMAGWLIGTVLGIVLWGGWTTAEPRNLLAPAIVLLGVGVWIVAANLRYNDTVYAYPVGAVLIWAALNFTGRLIHPLNPIGSGDPVLKITYGLVLIAMGLLGYELTLRFKKGKIKGFPHV